MHWIRITDRIQMVYTFSRSQIFFRVALTLTLKASLLKVKVEVNVDWLTTLRSCSATAVRLRCGAVSYFRYLYK